MNRYSHLSVNGKLLAGFSELLDAADAARVAGRRGNWVVRGILAVGPVADGPVEDVGMLHIGDDGVELREIEPAEATTG